MRTGSCAHEARVLCWREEEVTMSGEEGWYVDPFGHHEARWISEGTPTALVRDGSVESQDPPPSESMTEPLDRIPGAPTGSDDQKRADDVDAEGFDPNAGARAAFDMMDQIGTGVFWHPKRGRDKAPDG
jgi:hypothetical protein